MLRPALRRRLAVSLSVLGLALAVRAVAAADAPPETSSSAPDYRIGIEDVLRITVWGEAALDVRVRVRPDGKITFPLVNDINVDGLSPVTVREVIAAKLADYIREPNVTVIVEEINSFRVYVVGEVNRQGAINFNRPTRLLQAIAAAGGLTQFSKKEITLLREEGGVEKRIRVDYKRLIAGEVGQENPHLRPGDTILVN